ncbi:MAG: hypothetical protein ACO1SX_16740 [Actinomycetota bacterium]
MKALVGRLAVITWESLLTGLCLADDDPKIQELLEEVRRRLWGSKMSPR